MRTTHFVVACLTLLVAWSGSARAAEVTCHRCDHRGVFLVVTGEIGPGDLAKMQSLVSYLPKLSGPQGPAVRLVGITSPGGDVHEAMKIGRWLRQHEFTVTADKHCASACIFVLSAGVLRLVTPNTAIVIHRPYLLEMPPGKNLQQAMQDILRLSKSFFAEMNMPENLADEMFSIDPAKGRKLSPREISAYRLDQEDLAYQEESQLKAAQRLGVSRGEYLQRLRAFEQSGSFEACERQYQQTDDPDRLKSCLGAAHKRFGLQ